MYFKNRSEAGKLLAAKLSEYRYENTAVVALSDGAVVVGAEIAISLHCVLTMLLTEAIQLPGESDDLAVIDQEGGFTYNSMFSAGQLEAFNGEYQSFIEQAKREKLHHIHELLGGGGIIRPELLRGHNVILVSDGLDSGVSLEAATMYLKPIKTEKIIIASTLATVRAVDKMHLLGDKIECLSVIDNYMGTDHYYEDNSMPDHEALIKTIKDIVVHWK